MKSLLGWRAALLLVLVPAPLWAQATRDDNLALGNPSGATTSTSNANNYLMVKPQFAVSYNKSKATPNWVSWHLSTAWLGSASRASSFRADGALPTGWSRVYQDTYTGSGFDRGHMCPSADRTKTDADNDVTFLGTNIVPQAAYNNQGPWEKFETYCRTLASQGNELYIIAGPSGTGGTGTEGRKTSISGPSSGGGTMTVNVPAKTWKVAVVLPNGSSDASRVKTSTRAIAIIMPNDNTALTRSTPWGGYRVKVRDVEALTGFNFFSALPQSVQDAIESRVDNGPTQ